MKVRLKNYQRREDAHFNFYYNRHIVNYRIEKVPACKFHSSNYYLCELTLSLSLNLAFLFHKLIMIKVHSILEEFISFFASLNQFFLKSGV